MRDAEPQSNSAASVVRPCEVCLRDAPTRFVTFECNIGMVVRRVSRSVSGALCRDCISRYFWEFTITNLFFGWWGVISFFRTLYLLPANVIEFLLALRLPRVRDPALGDAGAAKGRARFIRGDGNDVKERVRRAYLALEVPPGSDLTIVDDAYRRLMHKYDPALSTGSPDKHRAALELTRRLTEAHQFLETQLRR